MIFGKKQAGAPTDKFSEDNDNTLALSLRESAQRTAELAGALRDRGWSVSVYIHPHTSDKGPVGNVEVYRTQTLVGS